MYTSNVDGAFQKAGFGHNVLECHGSIHYLQSLTPGAGSELIDASGFKLAAASRAERVVPHIRFIFPPPKLAVALGPDRVVDAAKVWGV